MFSQTSCQECLINDSISSLQSSQSNTKSKDGNSLQLMALAKKGSPVGTVKKNLSFKGSNKGAGGSEGSKREHYGAVPECSKWEPVSVAVCGWLVAGASIHGRI